MTNKKPARILAIDPGTREIGIAVLEDCELVYHSVKTIRSRRSPHEILKQARAILLRLVRDFRPSTVVFEKTFFANNRNTALLNVFTDELRAIAGRKRLAVVGLGPSTVKKAVCGTAGAAKSAVAEVVAAAYPSLKPTSRATESGSGASSGTGSTLWRSALPCGQSPQEGPGKAGITPPHVKTTFGGTILRQFLAPFPLLRERSSPSRVRSAAANNGAPLTVPVRPGEHVAPRAKSKKASRTNNGLTRHTRCN